MARWAHTQRGAGPDREVRRRTRRQRLNGGLPFGNFELDGNTGVVRFKASVEAAGDDLTDAIVAGLVRAPVMVMNRYLSDIDAVAGALS